LSKRDYLNSLEALKGRDFIGVAGEFLGGSFGAAAGVASAGPAASFVGVSTLLGSSTLGTLLGGICNFYANWMGVRLRSCNRGFGICVHKTMHIWGRKRY
jgi:hypothetical protein